MNNKKISSRDMKIDDILKSIRGIIDGREKGAC